MVKLYTTKCPKCLVLEKKLVSKGVDFILETDVSPVIEKGYSTAPILQVDDEYMEFPEAVQWVNNYSK